jgi:hypothetical protein
MALPQRKSYEAQSPNTYQYQIRNAKKVERKGLNTDFQYLNDPEFANDDARLLSSANPTLRAQSKKLSKKAANAAKYSAKNAVLTQTTSPIRRKITAVHNTKSVYKFAKATVVSAAIFAWGMTLWTIQLVFAAVSTVFLGVMYAGDAVINSNFITRGLGWAVERATEGATWFISGTAVSASDMTAGMFFVLWLVSWIIGVITLCAASLQYMMALIDPLGGDEAGMKKGAFCLAIFFYGVPILNLFPWFLFFVAVVWKYPK